MEDLPQIDPEIKNLFNKISNHIRSRIKLIVVLFIIGLSLGIPIAYSVIDWLLNADLLPADVNIIVLTPVEFIMLQVRVGAWLGAGLALLALIIDGAWKSELTSKVPKPGRMVVLAVVSSVILSVSGLLYSWHLLTPCC